MADPVFIVEILPTKIWVEGDILGNRIVVVQHEGMEPFDYATFGYRYGYTDNATTHRMATKLAVELGAEEPVEQKLRSLNLVGVQKPTTALDHFIDDVEAADIRDAARYRHLVATCNVDFDPSEPWQLVIWEPSTGEDWKAKLDAAIDAAMQGDQP
jgi:hypothetical protein